MRRVTLVVEHLHARNGADLMGREILAALNGAGLPLTVVSRDRWPSAPGLGADPDLRWLTPPSRDAFPRDPSLRTPRRVARWALRRVEDVPKRYRLRKALNAPLVANGFSNAFALGDRDGGVNEEAVLVVHDSPTKYRLPGQPPLAWAVSQMTGFSRYVFNSDRVREAWSPHGGIGEKPARIIPNCCREEEVGQVLATDRREIRRRLGWPEDRVIAVCVASLQPRKGQDLLVRALPEIRRRVPGVQLVLVGVPAGPGGESYARSLVEEAARVGCADRLALAGYRDDALDVLHAADLLLLASRSESMPLTILEAMALRKPVVASNVDAIPDLVDDGRTGRLFPCDDVHALTNAVADVAFDPTRCTALGQAGHERYWSRFSRRTVGAMYAEAVGCLARGEAW